MSSIYNEDISAKSFFSLCVDTNSEKCSVTTSTWLHQLHTKLQYFYWNLLQIICFSFMCSFVLNVFYFTYKFRVYIYVTVQAEKKTRTTTKSNSSISQTCTFWTSVSHKPQRRSSRCVLVIVADVV